MTQASAIGQSEGGESSQATRGAVFVTACFYFTSALAVRLVGPRLWGFLPDLLAFLHTRKPTPRSGKFARRMGGIFEGMDDQALRALHRRNEAAINQRVVFTTALRRRQGWGPEIVLTGVERVEQARQKGKGVIIWSDPFAHANIIGKRAFAEAGIRAWHLSSSGHGLANSPLARRYINPRLIEVELRYLAGRIVFDRQTTMAATREMMKVLAGNGIVSLTNNAYMGKTLATPFGRGMMLRLARTPLRLAALEGVPLLPFQVIERERFQRYEVIVGPDLSNAVPAGSADPTKDVAAAYAAYLLELACRHCEQFTGWLMMKPEAELASS